MSVLTEFKRMFVVGEPVWTHYLNRGDLRPMRRQVLFIRSTKVAMTNPRNGIESPSWLDWPRAREIRRDGDRFIVTFWPGNEVAYWKDQK